MSLPKKSADPVVVTYGMPHDAVLCRRIGETVLTLWRDRRISPDAIKNPNGNAEANALIARSNRDAESLIAQSILRDVLGAVWSSTLVGWTRNGMLRVQTLGLDGQPVLTFDVSLVAVSRDEVASIAAINDLIGLEMWRNVCRQLDEANRLLQASIEAQEAAIRAEDKRTILAETPTDTPAQAELESATTQTPEPKPNRRRRQRKPKLPTRAGPRLSRIRSAASSTGRRKSAK